MEIRDIILDFWEFRSVGFTSPIVCNSALIAQILEEKLEHIGNGGGGVVQGESGVPFIYAAIGKLSSLLVKSAFWGRRAPTLL